MLYRNPLQGAQGTASSCPAVRTSYSGHIERLSHHETLHGRLYVAASANALQAEPVLTVATPAAQISGKFNVDGSGNVDFKEEDGIDYAPVTVQMPGGERVPFLFTIKELQAKASVTSSSADPQICTSKDAALARLKDIACAAC